MFREITPSEASDAIDLIGKDWMLIGTADKKHGNANAMTASWGALGFLWNRPVCICFIRPQRYTFGLAKENERLSFSFFGEEYRKALTFCGKESGRNGDKLEKAGLTYSMAYGVPVFDSARLTVIGRKLYSDEIKKTNFIDMSMLKNYPAEDFHTFYICEIERCFIKNR